MKKSKSLKSIIALTCCLAMGLGALTGCGGEPECEHVYTVVDTVESTCTQAGRQTLSCGICGDIKYEDLPINENAHVFTGEWQITLPTEEADGVAVKTCVNNPEHKLEVTLPMVTITGSGYDAKEFITVPTTAREGEMKLTLKNEYGDITFNVTLAKRVLDNMEDAVVLASSLQENVRSSEGWFKETADGMQHAFSYYFGDDYTHITDEANNKESWYSLDDENKIFAMSKALNSSAAATVDTDPDANCLDGFHYISSVDVSTFYGAENGLAKLYDIAKNGSENGNTVKYEEISKAEIEPARDGSLNDLWFSYGYDSGSWFARFKVVFSTFSDGTLKKLEVQTEIIRAYMIAREADESAVYYKEGDASVVKHGASVGDIVFGYVYPTDFSTGGIAYETDKYGNVLYEQTNKLTGNVVYFDGEYYYDVVNGKEVENPDGTISYVVGYEQLDYVPELEDVYIQDVYGEFVLDSNGNKIKKAMARGGYPVTEHYSDAHSEVSYKTVSFTQTKKVTQEEIDAGLKEPEVVPENPYPYDSLYIRDFDITGAKVAGSTADISSGLTFPTNKVITLNFGNISPSTASLKTDAIANIYIKDVTGALIKLKFDFGNGSQYKVLSFFTPGDGTVTINSQYAGTLTFVFETQSGKCTKEVDITFTKSAPTSLTAEADVYTVTNGVASVKTSGVNATDRTVNLIVGQSLTFRAQASGEEAAYVSTDILPTCSSTAVTLTQKETGSFAEWELVAGQPGEYIIKMPYYDGTTSSESVYAEFKVTVSARLQPMEMLSGNTFSGSVLMARPSDNPISRELTALFTTATDDGGETIDVINISVNGNTCVYTYGVDNDGNLVTAYLSGVEPTETSYNFSFAINEAGDLVVTHGTGFGQNMEDIVLTKVVASESQS
ncbi:MAG: hypothetical protein ACI4QI_05375 [Candidatus Coproplasma sp.]